MFAHYCAMIQELTNNERDVLNGLIAFPDLNDQQLAARLGLRYSTFCTIRKKLRDRDYYSTIKIPVMQKLGAEMFAVIYSVFNPAITVTERAEITRNTVEEDIWELINEKEGAQRAVFDQEALYKNIEDMVEDNAQMIVAARLAKRERVWTYVEKEKANGDSKPDSFAALFAGLTRSEKRAIGQEAQLTFI